ncbi:hypothetical protein OHA91_22775 [Streptomyces erythrochromogenes]|uniref:Uncharacterized protein n=1 Tax=Streptomyces erythrochromogenes TaxID=285574 RepID=A0ABZ1QEI7_9ACTN|nr:hypothetical protein [Streptomyces erythrochromogenes]
MQTSRVPAAVDAFLELLRAADGLANVRILDGPPTTNLADDWLSVGWQPGGDGAVTLTQAFAGAGARQRDEDFSIHCYAESRAGGTDLGARRRRVFEIVGEVETILRASNDRPEAPTLNGTVLWAHLTAGDLVQVQAEGALAGLDFTLSCRARI